MKTFRIMSGTMLMSLIMTSEVFAVCPCRNKQVRFAQPVVQAPVRNVAQSYGEDQTAKAIAASKQAFEQKQRNEEAQAVAESIRTQEQNDLERVEMALIEDGIACSIMEQTAQEAVNVSAQTANVSVSLKDRIKNWFTTKWQNSKTYAGLAKDYVAENTSNVWAKTKNGAQRGWTNSKLAIKKLWFKINPDLNRTSKNKKASLTATE